jgi:hypothetical protein
MRAFVISLLAFSASLGAIAGSRGAVPYHPWCARYADRSGATICAFDSQASCLADVRGVGGFCVENVAAPHPIVSGEGAYQSGRIHRKRRHHTEF